MAATTRADGDGNGVDRAKPTISSVCTNVADGIWANGTGGTTSTTGDCISVSEVICRTARRL